MYQFGCDSQAGVEGDVFDAHLEVAPFTHVEMIENKTFDRLLQLYSPALDGSSKGRHGLSQII